MKKFILLVTILFVSVISTACINNLAVQELNNVAKEYMANGEPEKAVCRLRSSLDLDTNIFESHYNLGVALIELKEYKDAQLSLENAAKLRPEFADTYYSLAVAFENQADEVINPSLKDDDADDDKDEDKANKEKDKKSLSDSDKLQIVKLLDKAVENYNTYLVKRPDAEDKDKVNERINSINDTIKAYTPETSTDMNGINTQGAEG